MGVEVPTIEQIKLFKEISLVLWYEKVERQMIIQHKKNQEVHDK